MPHDEKTVTASGGMQFGKTLAMKRQLLNAQHARQLAEFQAAIEQARHETQQGGWRHDWSIAFDQHTRALLEIESQIEQLTKGNTR